MIPWLILLSTLVLSPVSANFMNAVGNIGDAVSGAVVKEVAAVVDPIEKTAINALVGRCKGVKTVLGVDPKNVKEDRNVTELTIDFYTKDTKVTFNLTDLSSITSSNLYKPKEKLIIFFHGFTDSPDRLSSKTVVNTLLYKDLGNILALDSSPYISSFYLRSSTFVQFIGQAVGKALTDMTKAGLDLAAVHLIGHSLGSHIASFTGKTVLDLTGFRVGRISGLDPAGPCFYDVGKSHRLNKNDAEYVDVIHTNDDGFGLGDPMGHADYYPNRGTEQPDCVIQVCSHDRSWIYYAESILYPQRFVSIKCSSWTDFENGNCDNKTYSFMGYSSRSGTLGNFYLQTNEKYPYARGVNGVKYVDNDGIVRNVRDFVGL